MAIVFYYGSGSPFAWRVWLALEHKKLPYELRVMSFDKDDLKQPAFQALTPRGRVPLIQDGDYVLYESGAIIEYLQDAYPSSGAGLFPADPKPRGMARRRRSGQGLPGGSGRRGRFHRLSVLCAGAAHAEAPSVAWARCGVRSAAHRVDAARGGASVFREDHSAALAHMTPGGRPGRCRTSSVRSGRGFRSAM